MNTFSNELSFRPRMSHSYVVYSPNKALDMKTPILFVKYCMKRKLISDPVICNMKFFNVNL